MNGYALCAGARVAPRRATLEDVPLLLHLFKEKYPGYSVEASEAWGRAVIGLPHVAFFICGQSVGIVAYQTEFWRPLERIADLVQLYGRPEPGDPWASYRVLKACIAWAKEEGCYAIRFGSTIDPIGIAGGVDRLAAFAKRLKAKPWGMTYAVEF